jgi:hypothetical protein
VSTRTADLLIVSKFPTPNAARIGILQVVMILLCPSGHG